MATLKIPYFRWRDGRPRWEPGGEGGRRLARGGFKAKDLKDETGAWLGYAAAIARASEINAAVEAWRKGGQPRLRPPMPKESTTSCRALWAAYQDSPRWRRLAPQTQGDYTRKALVFLDEFGRRDATSLRKHHLYVWWEELHASRGHAMANGTLAVARLVLSHAIRLGWIEVNPASELGLEGVPPRCVVWTPSEIQALLAAADALAVPQVGDAIVIALDTGQRQGDVLRLETPQIVNGRAYFRQSKTRARVSIPLTTELQARLAAIHARHRPLAGPIVPFPVERRLVLAGDGRPYTRETFGVDWRRVRARAAETVPECAGKLFLDLRDTAVTRLALAGCTVPEIRAITGHSMQTIHSVLQHYLALDDRMADAAIARLREWKDQEGIAI